MNLQPCNGFAQPSCHVQVAKRHATVTRDADGDWHLKWSGDGQGLWCSGKQLKKSKAIKIRPGDVIEVGKRDTEKNTFQVKLCHLSLISGLTGLAVGDLPERRHSLQSDKYVEA